jgi:hypothetical protein
MRIHTLLIPWYLYARFPILTHSNKELPPPLDKLTY